MGANVEVTGGGEEVTNGEVTGDNVKLEINGVGVELVKLFISVIMVNGLTDSGIVEGFGDKVEGNVVTGVEELLEDSR